MKEMFSISTGVNVAKVKPTTKGSKEISVVDDKTSSKDFLSIMFEKIKDTLVSTDDGKLDLDIADTKENVKIDLETKTDKKSVDNHLLEDLLKVVSLLKNPDAKVTSFPSLSNKLEKLINSENAIKELKEVKNITDLLKISKKYDLGLEKISVKNLDFETLKKDFPVLAKKEFFTMTKEEINTKGEKIIADVKKDEQAKPTVLSINNIEKPKTKKEPTLFEKIMSTPKEDKKEASAQVIKEIVKDKVVEEKKDNIAIKTTQEVEKTVKVVQEEAPKVVVKEDKKDLKTKTIKEDLHVDVKTPDTTRVSEPKVEANTPKKGMIENILQGIKTEKTTTKTEATNTVTTENSKIETKASETTETKTDTTVNRADLKPQIKTDTLASKQLAPTKDTFTNFAADFKEKLENYKPPFMRVQMALNPKGLGEVDVTIVNRGSNLHVNITSNTNSMSIFTQNQAEFKNSLVNMGFTNLEMNFSDQRERDQHNSNKNSKESSDFFEDENIEDETTSIELVVPQYV
jgi:hypothetical protein